MKANMCGCKERTVTNLACTCNALKKSLQGTYGLQYTDEEILAMF